MKKILLLLMAVICLFAASASAAEVLAFGTAHAPNNVLWIDVELTGLAPYKVSLKSSELVLTVDAPLAENVSFNGRCLTENYPLIPEIFPSASKSKLTVRMPFTKKITEEGYRVWTFKGDRAAGRPARIVMEVTADIRPTSAEKDNDYEYIIPPMYSMEDLSGTWYDEYGQPVCSIDVYNNDYTEKGKHYEILGIGRREAPEKQPSGMITGVKRNFLVLNDYEGRGFERKIGYVLGTAGRLKFLVHPDYPTALQKGKEVDHYEAVGGVYLGMAKRLVEERLGRPDSVNEEGGEETAEYRKDGLTIRYVGNRVDEIIMHEGSTKKFDRSGLTSGDPLEKFEAAYNIAGPVNVIGTDNFETTPGYEVRRGAEYLYFVKNGDIILTPIHVWK